MVHLEDEKKPTLPWELRGRVNQPTAEVLRPLKDESWGLVIWEPCAPFAFGHVVAAVCTAGRGVERCGLIGRLLRAAPQLCDILDGLVCSTCGNRIGWNGAKSDIADMDWRACAACKPARDLLAEIRDGQ